MNLRYIQPKCPTWTGRRLCTVTGQKLISLSSAKRVLAI